MHGKLSGQRSTSNTDSRMQTCSESGVSTWVPLPTIETGEPWTFVDGWHRDIYSFVSTAAPN